MDPASTPQPIGARFGEKLRALLQFPSAAAPADPSLLERERERMIELVVERGVRDARVLAALRKIARHEFVPPHELDEAYADRALPIGGGQTISQPYIVALMTEALALDSSSRVLEIGTGSGYQTAILCELAADVTTIEAVPGLARAANESLTRAGYSNFECRTGDGHDGAPDRAPFDAVIVTAAPESVPRALVDQLAVGGRMSIPVGAHPSEQVLLRMVKQPDGSTIRETLAHVRFVPMVRTIE
jgi:protein-L-isoaspartate(D-aspartate) O-methyltransferase